MRLSECLIFMLALGFSLIPCFEKTILTDRCKIKMPVTYWLSKEFMARLLAGFQPSGAVFRI